MLTGTITGVAVSRPSDYLASQSPPYSELLVLTSSSGTCAAGAGREPLGADVFLLCRLPTKSSYFSCPRATLHRSSRLYPSRCSSCSSYSKSSGRFSIDCLVRYKGLTMKFWQSTCPHEALYRPFRLSPSRCRSCSSCSKPSDTTQAFNGSVHGDSALCNPPQLIQIVPL